MGGAWVLSSIVGALSYAGFYQGQWGWFVPLAGPMLSMSGVDGGQPTSCFSKAGYTYTLGSLLMIITMGGLATTIAGAVATKSVRQPVLPPPPPPPIQITPTAGPGSAGLILLGTF